MGGDVGVDRHVVGEQDCLAAIGQGQRAVDSDALAGRHLQAAQLEAVEQFAVQAQAALALGGHQASRVGSSAAASPAPMTTCLRLPASAPRAYSSRPLLFT